MQFSNWWLHKFRKRNKLKRFVAYGESADTYAAEIERELPDLRVKLSTYEFNAIWKDDECGLWYMMPPKSAVRPGHIEGCKKQKMSAKFLPCANSDGTEKIQMMMIGKAQRPRWFKRKIGDELGFHHRYNNEDWMNCALFSEWLDQLDTYIGQKPKRRAALLLDKCSAHCHEDKLPNLVHVDVSCLPIIPLEFKLWTQI